MNQFFSLKRFSLLVLKHWAESRKRYSLAVLAFLGLLTAWFIFAIVVGDDMRMSHELQGTTYFFSIFIAGTVYASQYFRHLGSTSRGINFLLVPASSFEKILCSILYTAVLFFVVFTAAFYLIDSLAVAISNSVYKNDPLVKQGTVINVFKFGFFELNDRTGINLLLFFFAVQSVFLLGSVSFNKFSFLKTVISIFIAFMICFWLTYLFFRHLFPEDIIPAWIGTVVSILAMYVLAPLFWIFTYRGFKRKQV